MTLSNMGQYNLPGQYSKFLVMRAVIVAVLLSLTLPGRPGLSRMRG